LMVSLTGGVLRCNTLLWCLALLEIVNHEYAFTILEVASDVQWLERWRNDLMILYVTGLNLNVGRRDRCYTVRIPPENWLYSETSTRRFDYIVTLPTRSLAL
jgi:ABC-type antimicrobial peptide transport system ATPase subunit